MMLIDAERYKEATRELWLDALRLSDEQLAAKIRLGIVAFAEAEFELPQDSAVRGKFRIKRMPFLRGPLEALENPRVRQVVVAKGSQLAFTTLAQIWKAWTMLQSPASMISVWPSQGLLKRYVLLRINPMLEDCESLRALFNRSGLRDSDDSLNHKGFPGGAIDFVTGRSSSQLKSITVQRMHVSELDELEADLKGQGDPLDQARRALRTHHNSKEYLECTPTRAGASRVWRELELSSWNEYFIPCPQCNAPQVLRWREGTENGDSEGSGKYHFVYDLDTAGRVVPGSTRYVCVKCQAKIEHEWKRSMINEGEWVSRYPDREAYQGFHLSALYALSGDYNWDACAQLFVNGIKKPATRKVFVNTIAGLPYTEEEGDRADLKGLQARAELYGAQIPQGVEFIVGSVDVQGDRLEYLVIGFGAGEEWWIIEWSRVEGDPAKRSTWDKLELELNRDWTDADGVAYGLMGIAIDAGFMSQHVKNFCARFTTKDGVRPIHVIGRAGRARPLMEKPGADVHKRRRSKRPSWILGTDTMNDLIYARLRITEPGPEYMHSPSDAGRVDPAFYPQLTSEKLESVYVGGIPVRKWVLPADARNEGLDLTRMCYGVFISLGPRVQQQLHKLTLRPRVKAERKAQAIGDDGKSTAAAPIAQERRSLVSAKKRTRPRVVSKGVY